MENGRKIAMGIAIIVLILAAVYFVMSITSSVTGNVIEGESELIESEEVIPEVYAKSSPGGDVAHRGHGCSWDVSEE